MPISTAAASPSGRNPRATGRARPRTGHTRDPVPIGGTVQAETAAAVIPARVGGAFAAKSGFDPRELDGCACLRIRPQRREARHGPNELAGLGLIRGGDWVTA